MARSATLNPASMPFFPGGGMRITDDDLSDDFGPGISPVTRTEHDRNSSALSTSPSEYRSVRSSPSPPQFDTTSHLRPPHTEELRSSPTFRQVNVSRQYPPVETRQREPSSTAYVESYMEERKGSMQTPMGNGKPTFFHVQQQQGRLPTPPVAIGSLSAPSARTNGIVMSSSPASSMESSAFFTNPFEQQPPQQQQQPQSQPPSQLSFDAQLRASPVIRDIIERLTLCEQVTREVHRGLADVDRKASLLNTNGYSSGQPEFQDPFATTKVQPTAFNTPTMNPRPSISGGIAPHQAAPGDDVSSISQRLNTLTSSVGQLLALQTQQIQQNNATSSLLPNRSLPPITSTLDIGPQQSIAPNGGQNMVGLGMPPRPELRQNSARAPNAPVRTWSASAIDIPMRSEPVAQRPDSRLMDKRRSVSGLLRRESVGVIDPSDNGHGRDNGPTITKWEQLPLAPELQRSLTKFGVGPPNKIQQRALPFLLRGSDIIAQAPPTQERIAAYVIPAIQIAVTSMSTQNRGPLVVIVSTTVDQATQAQRMIRDLGTPIGIRSALGAGAGSSGDLTQEIRTLQQSMPHIICGTPQKLHSLFTAPAGLSGAEVRLLVLDEVDQLIARNLHDFVFNIVKLLPPPRTRPPSSSTPVIGGATGSMPPPSSFPLEANNSLQSQGRRFSNMSLASTISDASSTSSTVERQTALFSNTVPQDVLNLATAIQLREPVRVLVRRDGNTTQTETNQGSRGLRQFYLYLAFTAGMRPEPGSGGGLGIIGSGRGASSTAESAQAREWKLDALADLFDDLEIGNAVIHVGGMTALDSVVYKLASRGLDAVPLHGDMNPGTKLAALNKFRSGHSVLSRQGALRVLVVYDVQIKASDVTHVPLVINYDLPKAVEEYAHRVAPAIASGYARPGVVVNFITATGGDVEMLRSIECFYKIKCPEVPMSLRDIV